MSTAQHTPTAAALAARIREIIGAASEAGCISTDDARELARLEREHAQATRSAA